MALLIAGLVIWSLVHFIPSLAATSRNNLRSKLGEGPYMGLFSIVILSSLAMIIFGWRNTIPSHVYHLSVSLKPLAYGLMGLAFLLFGAANLSTRIKRFIRHPQLSSVIVWAVAHLMLNGDDRSIVLFGGLLTWAVLSIIFINKRDGEWVKPSTPSLAKEAQWIVVSLAIFAAVAFAHPYLAGVAII